MRRLILIFGRHQKRQYYISLVISPIAIVLIYCFDKQMLESMLCCCCHKKKTEVNKELTISLFEEQ